MKRIILIAFVFVSSFSLSAQEGLFDGEFMPSETVRQSNKYYSFGGGFPALVTFSAGHRWQCEHYGFDLGVGTTPLIFVGEVHAYTNFLYYPKPLLKSQAYYGIGSNYGYAFVVDHLNKGAGFIQPSLIFGKEYMNNSHERRFLQAEISPVLFTTRGVSFIPRLTVTYGVYF